MPASEEDPVLLDTDGRSALLRELKRHYTSSFARIVNDGTGFSPGRIEYGDSNL